MRPTTRLSWPPSFAELRAQHHRGRYAIPWESEAFKRRRIGLHVDALRQIAAVALDGVLSGSADDLVSALNTVDDIARQASLDLLLAPLDEPRAA